MITDKDIIVELLRQREELRDELAASKTGQEDKECVDELNRIIAYIRKDKSDLLAEIRTWEKMVDDLRQDNAEIKASYEVKQVEKIMAERDKLRKELDNAKSLLRYRTEYGVYPAPDQTMQQPAQNQ